MVDFTTSRILYLRISSLCVGLQIYGALLNPCLINYDKLQKLMHTPTNTSHGDFDGTFFVNRCTSEFALVHFCENE